MAPDFFCEIEKEIGYNIPYENVYFISIADFEILLGLCESGTLSLSDFIRNCSENDRCFSTRKFSMGQYIESYMINREEDDATLSEDELTDKNESVQGVAKKIKSNSEYWRSKGLGVYLKKMNLMTGEIYK